MKILYLLPLLMLLPGCCDDTYYADEGCIMPPYVHHSPTVVVAPRIVTRPRIITGTRIHYTPIVNTCRSSSHRSASVSRPRIVGRMSSCHR